MLTKNQKDVALDIIEEDVFKQIQNVYIFPTKSKQLIDSYCLKTNSLKNYKLRWNYL
jgi:hypothetical protein